VTVALRHVVDGPAGAPALLLGGALGTDLRMWQPLLGALLPAHRVVRFDHRGQGASPVPAGPYAIDDLGADVLALMDHLGLQRVAYAGISLGGMAGLWLAAHAPQRVDGLVICCSSARPGRPAAWAERAATVRAARSTAPVADGIVSRWLTPAFAAGHPGVVRELRDMLLASPPDGYAACCEVLAGLDLRDELAAVTAPTLVVAGADDLALPPDHGRAIADGVPGARFRLLPGAAHLPTAESPAALATLILDHLEASR
jgi:3-oxoadipate enol-lactonase